MKNSASDAFPLRLLLFLLVVVLSATAILSPTTGYVSQMSYPDPMDHIEVLREKIRRLREEIAQLLESHADYSRAGSQGRNEIQSQIAHGQRQERLQAIQQELAQLAGLSRRVLSVEQRKGEHRSRLHVVKKAS